MKISILAAAAVALAISAGSAFANPSLSTDFPGGYQQKVQSCGWNGCDTAKTWFLASEVPLTWDGSRYVVDGAKVVYDRSSKLFYLRFADTGGNTVYYGPLFSANDTHQAYINQRPFGAQSPAANGAGVTYYNGVHSWFMSDQVTLDWDFNLNLYVVRDAVAAYDRNTHTFSVYDGSEWAGPFPQTSP